MNLIFFIDIKDKKILQELDINPRITTSKLAKNIRLSQQVTNYRINKLVENKIITQFGTILNLSKIGYEQYRVLFQLDNINEEEMFIGQLLLGANGIYLL